MIPRWCISAAAGAALSAVLAACGSKEAGSQATQAPAANPASAPVDIEAEAQKAAAAINESNADAELEKLKAELESE